MRKERARHFLSLTLAVMLLPTILGLSGCDMLNAEATAAAKRDLNAFIEELRFGSFAEAGFTSAYVADAAFADLEFADDFVLQAMTDSLTTVTVDVKKVSASQFDGTGTCDISVSAIDLATLEKKYDFDVLSSEAFIDLVAANRIHKLTTDLTLKLVLDKVGGVWQIADSAPLAELLGVPFAEQEFTADYLKVIEGFVASIRDQDYQEYMKYHDLDIIPMEYFLSESTEINQAMSQYLAQSTLTIKETRLDEKFEEILVDVVITGPDMLEIDRALFEDEELIRSLMRNYILARLEGKTLEEARREMVAAYSVPLMEVLTSGDVPTSDITFTVALQPTATKGAGGPGFKVAALSSDFYVAEQIFYEYFAISTARDLMQEEVDIMIWDGLLDAETLHEAAPEYYEYGFMFD